MRDSKHSATAQEDSTRTHKRRQQLQRLFGHTLGVAIGGNAMIMTVAAQSGANAVCGTSVAAGATQTARLIVGLLVLACIMVAGIAEGYSRLKRDPQEAADIKQWRNGAAIGSVSTPVIIWFVIQVAGFFSIPVVSCVQLVPYI